MRNHISNAILVGIIGLYSFSAAAQDYETIFDDPLDNQDEIRQLTTEATSLYKKRAELEPWFYEALKSPRPNREGKLFLAEQLYRLIDEDSIRDLADLLTRRDTGDIARRGLEQIDHPDAKFALLESLRSVSGSTLVGVVEALGNLRAEDAVGPLRRFVRSGNSDLVSASLTALGKIGGPEAAQLLGMSRIDLSRSLRPIATEAYLRCGWSSLENGDRETALAVFDSLLIDVEPIEVRQEALRGFIRTEEANAVPQIIEILRSNETSLQTIAVEETAKLPGEVVTRALVDVFPDLTPDIQKQVVEILGERDDPLGLPSLTGAVLSRNADVRLAALRSLGKMNHGEAVQVLLKTSATGTPEERELAQSALRTMEGSEIRPALVDGAMNANNAIRLEAVKMVSIRQVEQAVNVLARIAERDIPEIQFEALKALSVVGTQEELPLMVRAWTSTDWSADQRAIVGEGIIAIAKRSPRGRDRVDPLLDALKRNGNTAVRIGIIEALGQIHEEESVNFMSDYLRKGDLAVQLKTIEVFGNWPSTTPADDLEKAAKSSNEIEVRDAAFDALAANLERNADPASQDTVDAYEALVKIANTSAKRDRLRSGIERLTHPDAAELKAAL